MMLELLYHKHNPLITTVAYKSTFLKKTKQLDYDLREKRKTMVLFLLEHYNDEIIINTRTKDF